MKKKIKDLTLKEAEQICDNHYSCLCCTLFISEYKCFKDLLREEKLEQEIEVEDVEVNKG